MGGNGGMQSIFALLRAKLRFAAVMATLAHLTTAVTFGSAIYAFFFPDIAAHHIAQLARRIEAAGATLDGIGADTRATAEATGQLAAALASRPRFEATLRRMGGLSGRPDQVQLRIDNPTASAITDLKILTFNGEGRAFSTFGVYVVPPFEGMTEIVEVEVVEVCYSYFTSPARETRVTELRRIAFSTAPTVDAMGNAASFGALPIGYELRVEPDPQAFVCGTRSYTDAQFLAEKARNDERG